MAASYLGTKQDPNVFSKWCKDREVFLHPDVAYLVPTKTMGSGVYAMKPLKKGTVIVSCPIVSAISPYEVKCTQQPCVAVLHARREEAKLPTILVVCLRLMAELARPKSPLRPWLECCPRMSAHLFGLEPSALRTLLLPAAVSRGVSTQPIEGRSDSGSDVAWSNAGQQYLDLHIESLWRQAQSVMADEPAIWPTASPVCSREGFLHCMTQIWSRNFHREEVRGAEGPYLLPGVDLINHSFAHVNTQFTMHGGGRSRELTFDVMASRDLQKGEQVYYNYGNMIEARYLLEFQFLNNRSAEDRINPSESLRFSREALESLCSHALVLRETDDRSSLTAPPEEVMAQMRDRIAVLHTFGLMSDEGIFAVRDPVTSGNADAPMPEDSTHFKGVAHDLWNIVYLLMCLDDKMFNDTKSKLTRHWRCPKSGALQDCLRRVLKLRLSSVESNLTATRDLLQANQTQATEKKEPSSNDSAVSQALRMLEVLLTSEASTLEHWIAQLNA